MQTAHRRRLPTPGARPGARVRLAGEAALQRLNEHYRRAFTFDDLAAEIWRRVYAFRQRSSRVPKNYLPLAEAQMLVAQDAGFGSWAALIEAAAYRGATVPAYVIDATENAHRAAPAAERRRVGRADRRHARSAASRRSSATA